MAIGIRQFIKAILLVGESSDISDSAEGSLWHNSTDNELKGYFGSAVRVFVTEDQTQTLTNKTLTSPVLNTGVSGTAILDEDDLVSNSDTQLATQQSIKAYVDAQVTAQDLDLTSDSGTIAIDLDSEVLTIAGGTGIDTSAATNTLTVAIDSTVATLTGSQTLENKTIDSAVINTSDIGTELSFLNQAEARFLEQSGNGTNYVGFEAPDSVAVNVIWKLPDADATQSGQSLTSDASGNLTWTTIESDTVRSTGNVDFNFVDQDTTDDDNGVILRANATDTGSGTEDVDFSIRQQINGTETESLLFDADGSGGGTGSIEYPAGHQILAPQATSGIYPEYSFQHTQTSGLYATGSQMRLKYSGSDKINISSTAVSFANATHHDAGSAGTPGIAFDGDANTGLFRATADAIGVSTGGAERARFTDDDLTLEVPLELSDYATGSLPTGAAGQLAYDTDLDAPVFHDGTSWNEIGGSVAGIIDYTPDFEAKSTGNVSTYDDGAVAAPVDGTGGSPSVATVASETTNELSGTSSFSLEKSAADGQGEGWAIDSETLARFETVGPSVISVSFAYETDANYTGNVAVYVYRVGSNTMEALNTAEGNNTLLAAPNGAMYRGQVSCNSSDTSIRLILHITDTDTTATDIVVDRISMAVDPKINAFIASDWETFTPSITWSTNTTAQAWKKRVGDEMWIKGYISLSGAPDTRTLQLTIPEGKSIDTNKVSGVNNDWIEGKISWTDNGTGSSIGRIRYINANTVNFSAVSTSTNYFSDITQAVPITWASGDAVHFELKVPIEGWSAGNVMSTSQADLRTLKAVYEYTSGGSANTSFADATDERVDFDSVVIDTHNSVTTGSSWLFTAPMKGQYTISCQFMWETVTNLTSSQLKAVVVDTSEGTNQTYFLDNKTTSAATLNGTPLVLDLDVNDTVHILAIQDDSASAARSVNSTARTSRISIVGLPDFSVFGVNGVSKTVFIKEEQSGGTAGGTATSGSWETRTLNTVSGDDDLVSLSSNQFTISEPGTYIIRASAPAHGVNSHKAKLRNTTDSTDDSIGTSEYSSTSNGVVTRSFITEKIIITSAKTFEIQHQVETTKATNGYGIERNFGVNDIYTIVEIQKVK